MRATGTGAALALAVSVCAGIGFGVAGAPLRTAGAATSSPTPSVTALATYHANLARTGFTPDERTIRPGNASLLTPLSTVTASDTVSVQPAVVDGVAYWGDWSGHERATSASGTTLWSTFIGTTTAPDCKPSTVGVASSPTVGLVGNHERVWTGGGNGTVVELAANSGRVIWKVRVAPRRGGFVWSSPALYDGDIYIGVSSFGDCPLVRGRILRIDAVTGAVLGTFFTTPQGCLGGGVWSSVAIDAASNSLFATTGNALCSTPLQNAMLQLDATTLRLQSSWQIPPKSWNKDSDWGSTPTLFSAEIGGSIVDLVGSADKNGIFYALRRSDLARGPVWQRRIALSGKCPQCGGGSISPAAFDGTNLYAAGGATTVGGLPCAGSVQALDPANGSSVWQDCLSGPVLGPVTGTPGLLFVASGADLLVLRSTTGSQIFSAVDPDGDDYFGGPAVSNGIVYCGNSDGSLFTWGLQTVTPRSNR